MINKYNSRMVLVHEDEVVISKAILEKVAEILYQQWFDTFENYPNPIDFIAQFVDKYGSKKLLKKVDKEINCVKEDED